MMRPAKRSKGATRGFFIPIGGAENRVKDPVILQRFVTLCGGPRAHIAVIPTASSRDDTGDRYESVFRNLGADRVSILPFKTRADCESERYLKELDRADGVFMTGGDQIRHRLRDDREIDASNAGAKRQPAEAERQQARN